MLFSHIVLTIFRTSVVCFQPKGKVDKAKAAANALNKGGKDKGAKKIKRSVHFKRPQTLRLSRYVLSVLF